MSTSGPSSIEENTYEIALLKEQMVEMMHMMQQLVVGGGRDSSSSIPKGFAPRSENEAQLLPNPNQGQTTLPFVP